MTSTSRGLFHAQTAKKTQLHYAALSVCLHRGWRYESHRLFSEISKHWAAEPLISYEKMLGFIRNTNTKTGLVVTAYLDRKEYPTGPVLVFSSSEAEKDIHAAYNDHANGYITKPGSLEALAAVVDAIEAFVTAPKTAPHQ
jgi:DNA-binding NarL/FixJ family response regulator